MPDIDPEGVTRFGGDCICGPVYTYAGHAEPGQFDPFCPDHGSPEYVASLREVGQCVGCAKTLTWDDVHGDQPVGKLVEPPVFVCFACIAVGIVDEELI